MGAGKPSSFRELGEGAAITERTVRSARGYRLARPGDAGHVLGAGLGRRSRSSRRCGGSRAGSTAPRPRAPRRRSDSAEPAACRLGLTLPAVAEVAERGEAPANEPTWPEPEDTARFEYRWLKRSYRLGFGADSAGQGAGAPGRRADCAPSDEELLHLMQHSVLALSRCCQLGIAGRSGDHSARGDPARRRLTTAMRSGHCRSRAAAPIFLRVL